MSDLRITIQSGSITGTGEDCIGHFSFSGTVTGDHVVRMDKQYVGRHRVDYHGTFDGHRCLHGEWWVDGMTGPWEITLLDADGPPKTADSEAGTEVDESAGSGL